MKEKLIIIFIALVVGLSLAGIIFYMLQTTKYASMVKKNSSPTGSFSTITPTIQVSPTSAITNTSELLITEPKDEALVDKRTVIVKGKTKPTYTILISSASDDIIISPSENGEFIGSITIETGANKLIIRAVSPEGIETIQERIVTYNTESF